jgi:hypothetical protein
VNTLQEPQAGQVRERTVLTSVNGWCVAQRGFVCSLHTARRIAMAWVRIGQPAPVVQDSLFMDTRPCISVKVRSARGCSRRVFSCSIHSLPNQGFETLHTHMHAFAGGHANRHMRSNKCNTQRSYPELGLSLSVLYREAHYAGGLVEDDGHNERCGRCVDHRRARRQGRIRLVDGKEPALKTLRIHATVRVYLTSTLSSNLHRILHSCRADLHQILHLCACACALARHILL